MATQTPMYRPSAPEVSSFLARLHGLVVAGTGHRPDKLGGYGNEGGDRDITRFQGTALSNFAPCDVRLDDVTYPNVEAAYQAAKTLIPEERQKILAATTPGEAKRLGKTVTLRPDWDEVKVEIMKGLLEQKFAQPKYRDFLRSTGRGNLVEGNTWGDAFWGTVNGAGQNQLGLLLMGIRSRLSDTTGLLRDPLEVLVELAEEYLRKLKPALVITGMALGWDTALALACVRLGIPFLAALPFPRQASRWPEKDQQRHAFLLKKAALVVVVGSDELADADLRAAMQWRNEFMVDSAQLILACFDGSNGGTANCIRDAQEQGKPIVNTYPKWCDLTGNTVTAPPSTAPVRTDGVQVTYEGRTITVYPVQGSNFFLGQDELGPVLIRKDMIGEFTAKKDDVQSTAKVWSEFLYLKWCQEHGYDEDGEPTLITHAGEELTAYPVGKFLAARYQGKVILLPQA